MITEKKYEIKTSKKNEKWLISKGYKFNTGETITINTKDLPRGSHKIIMVKCDVCSNEKEISFQKYIKNISNGGFYACSPKCAQDKVKATTKEKYGKEYYIQTEEYKIRYEKTCLEKYGVIHHTKNENIKEKQKETMLEKYGVEHYTQTEKYKENYKKQMLEKYGVENSFQSEIIKEKSKQTMIKKYGVEYFTQSNEWFPHSGITSISKNEKEIETFIIKNYSDKVITSDRKTIKPYELDILLPKLNLTFEFNGLYWHNELNKFNNYHKMKTDLCLEKGIQLIHIWEDDWNYKKEIVKSMILNKLGKTPNKIFARKTVIKEITDNKLIKDFLNKNHIQGFIGSSIKLALFYENELVSLMTFGKKRKMMNSKSKEGEYELLRFCNKLNTNVVGGASKLFKHFIKNYNYSEITTYADRSHSQGNLYEKLGFEFISITKPNYYYILNKKRHHRFNFRKDVLVKNGFDENKSEHEIMLERKIYRIYNVGNLKYRFNI
ncbi:MAG: hypothetical protein M0R46_13855 [Candidatus Muirbacterium halophilum]|nr:hypothetical protein [Candidatus Muirbacterium halophilum]